MATINEELTKLESTKADIKSALVEKGLNPTDEFSSYALNIRDILSGGSTEPVAAFAITNANKDNIVWPNLWADKKYIVISGDLPYDEVINLPDLTTDYNGYMLLNIYDDTTSVWVRPLNWNLTLNINGNNIASRLLGIPRSDNELLLYYEDAVFNITFKGNNQDLSASHLCSTMTGNLNVSFENVKITNAYGMFENSSFGNLKINGDFSKCTTFTYMFYNVYNIHPRGLKSTFNTIDTSSGTNFNSMFASCKMFNEIMPLDTSNGKSITTMFNSDAIIKIHEFSIKSATSISEIFSYTWNSNTTLRYCVMKDIGTLSSPTSLNVSKLTNWGIENSYYPELSAGARLSVIDSLITYSFDRAAAGYSTYTITLSANTKALLTEEEIAQITAKGYTIA